MIKSSNPLLWSEHHSSKLTDVRDMPHGQITIPAQVVMQNLHRAPILSPLLGSDGNLILFFTLSLFSMHLRLSRENAHLIMLLPWLTIVMPHWYPIVSPKCALSQEEKKHGRKIKCSLSDLLKAIALLNYQNQRYSIYLFIYFWFCSFAVGYVAELINVLTRGWGCVLFSVGMSFYFLGAWQRLKRIPLIDFIDFMRSIKCQNDLSCV